jgi:hypothetical protein
MLKRTLCGCAAIVMLAAAGTASAADKQHDLSGLWTNASQTTLDRPAGVTALEVSPQEAKAIVDGRDFIGYTPAEKDQLKHTDPNAPPPPPGDKNFGVRGYDAGWVAPGDGLGKVNGKYRTSHVIDPADGHVPYKNMEEAKQRAIARGVAYATGKGPYDGPEQTTISERCIVNGPVGPGMLHGLYNNNFKFLQTKDYLAIDVEMGHDMRIIPIFTTAQKAKASHGSIARWMGDSVAWWEGNNLVVESVNVNPLQGTGSGQFMMSPKAKVTEYFTRTGPEEVYYKFTVDDPTYYTKPWTADLTFQPINAIFEYACHEGNYGLEGILAGARAKEAEQAQAAK